MPFQLSVANTPALTNTLAYYEIQTLGIRNVFIVQALSKVVLFKLSVTNRPALTNTLAYYEIQTLGIRNVFIVQALSKLVPFQLSVTNTPAFANKHTSLLPNSDFTNP